MKSQLKKAQETDFVPMNKWGKDHWSTFAYIETRIVDHKGKLDNKHMRCNPRIHRQLANVTPFGSLVNGGEYPTRLKDGEIENHDDWSCVEDIEAAGLLTHKIKEVNKNIFGNSAATVKFTDLGYSIAAMLRKHKGEGKNFAEFNPTNK